MKVIGMVAALGLVTTSATEALPVGALRLMGSGDASAAQVEVGPGLQLMRGWQGWHGCYAPENAPASALMCLVPTESPDAVRMLLVDGEQVTERRIAPGAAVPVSLEGCSGTEQARWSADRRRVFLVTDLDCAGLLRRTTRILAFASEQELLDAEATTVSGATSTRLTRFRAADPSAVPAGIAALLPQEARLAAATARLAAAADLDTHAVIEAARFVAAPALEAMLAARGQAFALDLPTLLQLEREGVPPSTIDVLVAVSNPHRFAVAATEPATEQEPRTVSDRCSLRARWPYDPVCEWFRYGYGPYGYGRGSYFSPYRDGYWWADPWGGGRPVVIVIRDGDAPQPAQLVRGQGYTQGGSPSTGAARPRNGSGSGSGSGATVSSSPTGNAGSGAASGSGSSSGGSRGASDGGGGSSTGRTAVPRGGG